VYGDYVCNSLTSIRSVAGVWQPTALSTELGKGGPVGVHFGQFGGEASLLYTTYGDFTPARPGQLRRIRYTAAPNRAPIAAIAASPTGGPAPLAVAFDASASYDLDGDDLTYHWNFGDGGTAITATPTTMHTYDNPAALDAQVVVEDEHGATSAPATARITPGNAPPTITMTSPSPARYSVGQTVTVKVTVTDPEDGVIPNSSVELRLLRHHNTHLHPLRGPVNAKQIQFVGQEPEGLQAVENSWVDFVATAVDSDGARTTVTIPILPRVVQLGVATDPAGLEVRVMGTQLSDGASVPVWVGSRMAVAAPDQTVGGTPYRFASWSMGGGQFTSYTVPATDSTITATYVPGP
jgi:PKD repeat protein